MEKPRICEGCRNQVNYNQKIKLISTCLSGNKGCFDFQEFLENLKIYHTTCYDNTLSGKKFRFAELLKLIGDKPAKEELDSFLRQNPTLTTEDLIKNWVTRKVV